MNWRSRAAAAALVLAAPFLSGCFNPFMPEVLSERVTSTAPTPNTAQNAVRLFEWCWKNRGVTEYSELLSDDYVFLSAGVDSAGNATRDIQARRVDELEIAQNMFIGSVERPPAAKIELDFDKTLIPLADPRPGKDPSVHKTIRTTVNLKVDIGDGQVFEITGAATFYVVRGDSASIPSELQGRFPRDASRWWIDRWEDDTVPSGGFGLTTRAVRRNDLAPLRISMAQLKDQFRN